MTTIDLHPGFDLFFSGRQLRDSQTIQEVKLTDGDFLIVHEPAELTDQALELPPSADAVKQLCELGFSKVEANKALRSAKNDVDEAAGFLLTGSIPAPPPRPARKQQKFTNAPTLGFLRDNPQFVQLKRNLHNDPQAVSNILAAIGESNPALLQIINANATEFVNLLLEEGVWSAQTYQQAILQASQPSAATAATAIDLSAVSSSSASSSAASSSAASLAAAAAPGAQVITLTQKQKAAVDQLVGLGFGFDHALEVFMACGGNEQQAANILLEQMG